MIDKQNIRNNLKIMDKQLDALDDAIKVFEDMKAFYVALAYVNLQKVLKQFKEDIENLLEKMEK